MKAKKLEGELDKKNIVSTTSTVDDLVCIDEMEQVLVLVTKCIKRKEKLYQAALQLQNQFNEMSLKRNSAESEVKGKRCIQRMSRR